MKVKEEPCLPCKVVSVGCLLGIGGYLFFLGKQQPKSKNVLYSLSAASAALGVGEIFNKSPFR